MSERCRGQSGDNQRETPESAGRGCRRGTPILALPRWWRASPSARRSRGWAIARVTVVSRAASAYHVACPDRGTGVDLSFIPIQARWRTTAYGLSQARATTDTIHSW